MSHRWKVFCEETSSTYLPVAFCGAGMLPFQHEHTASESYPTAVLVFQPQNSWIWLSTPQEKE